MPPHLFYSPSFPGSAAPLLSGAEASSGPAIPFLVAQGGVCSFFRGKMCKMRAPGDSLTSKPRSALEGCPRLLPVGWE